MAVSNEMMLFANNFAYLTSCGFRTDLRFSCSEDGKIIADIHSDLGHFASLFPPPPIITPEPTVPEPIKPSQLRRLRKREHARNSKLNSSSSNLNFPTNDNVSPAHTMPTTNVNEEAAEGLDVGTVDVRCEPECNKNDKPDLTHYQTPINCIRQEDGCENVILSYYNKYTAICNSCTEFLSKKLQSTPFPHSLCPCCHQPCNGAPLSLCSECLEDVYDGGWCETGWGSWHLDRRN